MHNDRLEERRDEAPLQLFAVRLKKPLRDIDAIDEATARSRDGTERAGEVRWLRTYATRDARGEHGIICMFEAPDAAAVRTHAARLELQVSDIIPIPPA
jgi:hypothetical protein